VSDRNHKKVGSCETYATLPLPHSPELKVSKSMEKVSHLIRAKLYTNCEDTFGRVFNWCELVQGM